MRVADTSALFALFSESDAHHLAAMKAFEDSELVCVPHEIVAETMALVHFRIGYRAARAAGEDLRALPHLRWEQTPEDVFEKAWLEFATSGGAVSFPDAVVIAWCRARKARPIAFDRRILRRVTVN
ncbi:MAG: PIN domain-containing protein [Thermoplasmatota archaeon]